MLNENGKCTSCDNVHQYETVQDNGDKPYCKYCEVHYLRKQLADSKAENTRLKDLMMVKSNQIVAFEAHWVPKNDLKQAEARVAELEAQAKTMTGVVETLGWIADSGINGKHYQSHSSLVQLAAKTLKAHQETKTGADVDTVSKKS